VAQKKVYPESTTDTRRNRHQGSVYCRTKHLNERHLGLRLEKNGKKKTAVGELRHQIQGNQ